VGARLIAWHRSTSACSHYGGAAQAGKVAPLPAGNEAIVRKNAAGDFCRMN